MQKLPGFKKTPNVPVASFESIDKEGSEAINDERALISDNDITTASSNEIAETLTTVFLEPILFKPRHHCVLEARPIKFLEARRRTYSYQSNDSRPWPLRFMKAATVLLGLFGLCCAFDSIEEAVGQFNDESHLLFADPKTKPSPSEGLRVFTKNSIVVPELNLEDEIIVTALRDALRDFKASYSGKKDREWKRVIKAKKKLIESARWGIGSEEEQKVFLGCVVDLVFQHYERRALETGSEELKSRLKSVKRQRYPDNVPKSLEQTVFEENDDTWEGYRQVLREGGDVTPLMPVLGQRMFRKHVVSRVPGITLEQRGKNVVRISVSGLDEEQLDVVARNLWWLPYLETVKIRESGFSTPTIKELAKSLECLKHLKTLDLSNNEIESKDAGEIARKLASMPRLTTLNLNGNDIGNKGAKHIAKHLKDTPSLTTLNLNGNYIGNQGAKHIAKHLKDTQSLMDLNLCENDIGNRGAEHIAEHLGDAKSLTTLDLWGNSLGKKGTERIAEHLKDAPSLTTLDLCWNRIGSEGAWHIARHLKDASSLTTLNLGGNEIGSEGANHIAQHLKEAKSLTTLNLGCNKIGSRGAEHIAEHLKDVPSLTTLDLGGNSIENSSTMAKMLAHVPNLMI